MHIRAIADSRVVVVAIQAVRCASRIAASLWISDIT
jgi:hypothetical protein